MSYAMIYPGQGSQVVGMGRDIFDAFAVARDVFFRADEALGFALSKVIFEGPEEELKRTAITQPALLTTSIALQTALEEVLGAPPAPAYLAGHSLGEYTALVAGGALSFEDGVRLVHLRGTLMQEAVPEGEGAMAAILGLDGETVARVCEEAAPAGECQPANFNCPGQVVISGKTDFVESAMALAKERGAKRAVPLNVSAPFHSSLMRPVADKLLAAFDRCTWSAPAVPVVSNAWARPVSEVQEIQRALFDQTFMPVLWDDSVNVMADRGVDTFFEVGPGTVLSGLVRKCRKGLLVQACGTHDEVVALADRLKEMM
ncbi:MAG TPA: [acyl-carrier-protein] S-malonyltransferase [Synergistaceae bacterium]|jgi:[acyl-carrier-protein] S-malonyltransferase|nr:[acyl-carrier-protein] S-malonyltransferase [Synergistaceae bacterium]